MTCDIDEKINIRTEQNCVIKTFNKKNGGTAENALAYALSSGQVIKESKLTKAQYNIIELLAQGNQGDPNDDIDKLTMLDLIKARKRFGTSTDVLKNCDVTRFGLDANAGVATVEFKNGEVVRLEFGLNKPDSVSDNRQKAEQKLSEKSDSVQQTKTENIETKNVKKTNNCEPIIDKQQQKTVNKKDSIAFLRALGAQETRGKKTPYSCINYAGYAGKYQMGEQAMIEMGVYRKKPDKIINGRAYFNNNWKGSFVKNKYGITCLSDYLHSPEKQEKLQMDYKKVDWKVIKRVGLTKFIGKIINGQLITPSGLLAGAHLVGVGGLKEYFNGNYTKSDKSGTPVSKYIRQFAGYNVSQIIN